MTVENCKRLMKAAKTPEEAAFWEARIAHKIAKFDKYAHLRSTLNVDIVPEPPKLPKVRKNGKKSKR